MQVFLSPQIPFQIFMLGNKEALCKKKTYWSIVCNTKNWKQSVLC